MDGQYCQYFTGEYVYQTNPPIDPADFSKFRRRIGEEGSEKLLKLTIQLDQNEIRKETSVMLYTTVQEKNITFLTDVKLYRKIIGEFHQIAKAECIILRRS